MGVLFLSLGLRCLLTTGEWRHEVMEDFIIRGIYHRKGADSSGYVILPELLAFS